MLIVIAYFAVSLDVIHAPSFPIFSEKQRLEQTGREHRVRNGPRAYRDCESS